MQQQVVLLASSAEGSISAWDLQSGTHLTSYKGNGCPRNGLCTLGRDYLVAVQAAKQALHFWTWHKDAVLQRSFAVEPLAAVAASADGAYVAAGGASGSLYLWEAGSGRLVAQWPAHYKGVTALSFVGGGGCGGSALLVSGGDDTRVIVWSLAEVLDAAAAAAGPGGGEAHAGGAPRPAWCWSDHTLPVTCLAVAAGGGEAAAVVVSGSADRTLKLRRLADGRLLAAVALPSPVNALQLDAGQQALWAGCADGGVYQVPLAPGQGLGGPSGLGQGQDGGGAAAAGGPSGPGGGCGSWSCVLQGHTRAVSSLALGADGEVLVSGSEDGTARVWDLRSRQPVQVITAPGKLAVSCVLAMRRPHHMPGAHLAAGAAAGAAGGGGELGAAGAGQGASGKAGPRRPQPLAPLAKYTGVSGALQPWEGAPVLIDGSQPLTAIARTSGVAGSFTGTGPGAGGAGAGPGAAAPAEPSLSSAAQWAGTWAPPPGLCGGSSWEQVLGVGVGGCGAGGQADGAAQQEGQGGHGDGHGSGSQEEVDRLRGELAAAQAAAERWRGLHGRLHRFCLDKVVGGGAGGATALPPDLRSVPAE